ncbi:hypothetical protein D3C81_1356380 [compost metagenome]
MTASTSCVPKLGSPTKAAPWGRPSCSVPRRNWTAPPRTLPFLSSPVCRMKSSTAKALPASNRPWPMSPIFWLAPCVCPTTRPATASCSLPAWRKWRSSLVSNSASVRTFSAWTTPVIASMACGSMASWKRPIATCWRWAAIRRSCSSRWASRPRSIRSKVTR